MIAMSNQEIGIPVGRQNLSGTLFIPDHAHGLVLFAHGSGSSRHSPRNRSVAEILQRAGFATLLMDLLTVEEERIDSGTGYLRFDIGFLADRLAGATQFMQRIQETSSLPIGYFGASTGAAAALVAAAKMRDVVAAIVSRGGRPDLAGVALGHVKAPTLLIVGGNDPQVLQLNREALTRMIAAEKRVEIIPGAGHLFEEPGTLEKVANLARSWFARYLDHSALRTTCNLPEQNTHPSLEQKRDSSFSDGECHERKVSF